MAFVDLVVVGAGTAGLIAAHTWLQLHPESSVVVLESDTEVGGVWSRNRVYPTMMTQTPIGMSEYSCYPMSRPKETFCDFFPAEHVSDYFDAFSRSSKFAGKTVRDRIQFASEVTRIAKDGEKWMVEINDDKCIFCSKLIMAIGPTSTPNMPSFAEDDGSVPVIHCKDIAREFLRLQSSDVKKVAVLGGSKSAFDVVYLLCKAGKAVSWVIRDAGHGPATLAGPSGVIPFIFSNCHQILSLRLVSKMTPGVFDPPDAWNQFFQRSAIGRWIASSTFNLVDWMWRRAANYGRNVNFSKLIPDRPLFYQTDSVGIRNTPDLWDTISKATIYRGEITGLADSEVVLASGEVLNADALVACTGWKVSYPMFSTVDAEDLGLPVSLMDINERHLRRWEDLIAAADSEVLQIAPQLAQPPAYPERKATLSPNYLYRCLVPTNSSDQSVVFMGQLGTTHSILVAEIQSIWAVAYLTHQLPLPDQQTMEDEVALRIAWRRRRYLADGNTLAFDQIPYTSMLVRDLGLNDMRKGGWREFLQPYQPSDYCGLLDEWKASRNTARSSI